MVPERDRDEYRKGIALTESALASRRFSAYTPQAAVAAVHAEAPSAASTDWQIAAVYDRLIRIQPSPVWNLTAPLPSPCAGIQRRVLLSSMPCWRAENSPTIISRTPAGRNCVARLRRLAEASASYENALDLVWQESDRRFLAGRLQDLK